MDLEQRLQFGVPANLLKPSPRTFNSLRLGLAEARWPDRPIPKGSGLTINLWGGC